jgi:hypothetical protein
MIMRDDKRSAMPHRSWRLARTGLLGAGLLMALAACQGRPMNPAQVDPQVPPRSEAVNDLGAPAVITLETEPNAFWTLDYDRGDPLPNVMVGPVVADGVPVSAVVDALGAGLRLGVTRDVEAEQRLITVRDQSRRSLREMLEIISRRAGLFYEYRNGMLSFDSVRRFTVRVPRVEGSLLTISDAFRNLGAQEVFVDEITGTITMTVDYRTYRMTQQFLRTFEMGRDMLIYDVWVFERLLRRGEGAGIWWERLGRRVGEFTVGAQPLTASQGAAAVGMGVLTGAVGPTAPTGLAFGIISSANNLIANAVIQFMSEDSQNEAVARPTMTMMSGGSAEIRIGERRQYIARVRNTTTGAINAATNQDVEDETLETGLILRVSGAHNDGIINTKIDLNIEELVRFESFSTGGGGTVSRARTTDESGNQTTTGGRTMGTAGTTSDTGTTGAAAAGGGTTLRLPYTTNRTLRTMLDSRPGDLLVLGGLIRTKNEDADRRLFRTTVPFADQSTFERYETIMMMRPRLVRFRPRGEPPVARDEIRVAPGVGQNLRTETGPLIIPRDPRALERAARDLSVPARPRSDGPPFQGREGVFGEVDANETLPRPTRATPLPRAVSVESEAVSPEVSAPGGGRAAEPAPLAAPGVQRRDR